MFTHCTSFENSLFKQIVTEDKVSPLFISSEEVAVYVHLRVL